MNKHALICEDNLTVAHCISAMLEKLGYKSDIAQNLEDALIFLNKNKYDLMTLDILLSDQNGLDLIKPIQNIELAKDLPIIVISALKAPTLDLDSQKNIVYWLEKSFDMSSLETAVEDILEKKKQDKVNILHVENDRDILSLIDITLNDIANVVQIDNLNEAKTVLETKFFDIIILDYVFPEGTSDKLIPTIKSGINKNSKLIMFSAYEESKIIARYLDEIIIKTNVSFDDFRTCIEKFITLKAEM